MHDQRAGWGFQSRIDGEVVVAQLSGELDLAVSRELRDRLEELVLAGRPVIVELSGVSFANSSALGAFVHAQKQLVHEGRTLVLLGMQPTVRKLFAMTALDRFIPICESEPEATEVARRGAPAGGAG